MRYWGTEYDWRKIEAKMNALPQFVTEIDEIDIHFIHVRSKHPNALPVIITHGWPGSVFEQLKVIGPLTDPTAHGGRPEDAFDVVIPSMPGYGFSGKPTGTGWGPDHIARIWAELMKRIGYNNYVAQGGDWGSPVSSAMARLAPAGLLGIHINLPAIVPPEIATILAAGGPAPAGISEKERAAFDAFSSAGKMGNRSYAVMMGTRPQTVGYGLTNSPVGLAAWMLGHPGLSHWTYDDDDPEKSRDEVLDDITLYWLTESATSAARLYWEYSGRSPAPAGQEKPPKSPSPSLSPSFRARAIRHPRLGLGAPTAIWSIFTRSTKAVISQRGSSRSFFPSSFARLSDRSGPQFNHHIQVKERHMRTISVIATAALVITGLLTANIASARAARHQAHGFSGARSQHTWA